MHFLFTLLISCLLSLPGYTADELGKPSLPNKELLDLTSTYINEKEQSIKDQRQRLQRHIEAFLFFSKPSSQKLLFLLTPAEYKRISLLIQRNFLDAQDCLTDLKQEVAEIKYRFKKKKAIK